MKKENKRIFWSTIIYTVLSAVIIYSGIQIYDWYKDNKYNNDIKEKTNSAVIINDSNTYGENKYTVNFNSLKSQNSDTVAWIKLKNTKIEYPVVKSKDNEFYLNHSFDKSNNTAGWVFADYKNKFDGTDKNIVIYGHNRKDKSMFGSLKNVLTPDWYNIEENANIVFITENEKCIYKVFSVYQIEKESYYIKTQFSNDSEYKKFIKTIKERSIKNFKTDVSENDSILTLSTCAGNDKDRIVLHAKKYSIYE